MKLAAISGSLQAGSSNTALLHAAGAVAAAVEVVVFESMAGVPALQPDLDDTRTPAAVAELRALVGSSDGVLIATPEYAHGLPGALKNALDWLVVSGELYGKPVAIVSAAPSAERGVNARRDLARTLRAQGARVVFSSTVATRIHAGKPLDAEVRAAIETALTALQTDGPEEKRGEYGWLAGDWDADVAAVVRSEQRLLDPGVRGNPDEVLALLHDDYVEFGTSGRAWTRDDAAAWLGTRPGGGGRMERVRAARLDLDAIVVTYELHAPDAVSLRSSVWRRDGTQWRVFFHQGTFRSAPDG